MSIWKWQLNNRADQLADDRSAEVDVRATPKTIFHSDRLAMEVANFLQDRVKIILSSASAPSSKMFSMGFIEQTAPLDTISIPGS